ncbi:GntR family transcriptional regulator [Teichococcus oryzae]|uniref:GntR family transcriptional regulator n=1 Tax=Teichococcus oryzae TaxID=1608942 RepID=A0A5B2THV9_9PROT|nr:GntR family transcriptional regulator [Pseudoroseomonas oryzae]KAA2213370.1 GntR family transcriptional regulator [Pseudoroseomonas oryzae]
MTDADAHPVSGDAPLRSADRVYARIKAMAISYRLRPSERINEVELARQLGVSRTPLREALNRLAAEGFLEATANRGYSVLPLDPKRVLTFYEYRAMLEIGALRLAAARATDEALCGLAGLAQRTREMAAQDAFAQLTADEAFHTRLVALADNAEMLRSLRSLNERMRFIRWIDLDKGRGEHWTDEHMAMVEMLRARDAEAAAALMQAHIARRLDRITEMIRAGFAEIYTGNTLAARILGDAA